MDSTRKSIIAASDYGALYDAAAKEVLFYKCFLSIILRECTAECRDMELSYLETKCLEGEIRTGTSQGAYSMEEGMIEYDLLFHVNKPEMPFIVNLEAQNDFSPGYSLIKRAHYYSARLISSQKGTEFSGSDYDNIQKAYSIWICTQARGRWRNSITVYSMEEENISGNASASKEEYDLSSVVVIGLGHYNECTGLLRLLSVLLSTELSAEQKISIIEEEFGIDLAPEEENGVNNMCNLSSGVERIGIEKGLQQGLKQGDQQATEKAIRNLMQSMKCSSDKAMELLQIPDTEKSYYEAILK